jgi:hypothetical protein
VGLPGTAVAFTADEAAFSLALAAGALAAGALAAGAGSEVAEDPQANSKTTNSKTMALGIFLLMRSPNPDFDILGYLLSVSLYPGAMLG